ncbi:MAG: diguanylate cyclase, partial [Gammaproteobacteria bacterium]|nr:diguanylate cyclase [Gammaproteobacteria bacterium]
MRRDSFTSLQQPLAKRLRPLVYALIAMVAFILLLTWATLQVQTALAGFLNGESLWSKAQKQVTIDLLNYAATGDAADYADFQGNYAILEAYRSAREKVLSGDFDYDEVEQDLRRGGAIAVAIPKAIFLLDHFADSYFMEKALREWRASDSAVAKLKVIADELHRSYADGSISHAEIVRQRNRINRLNKLIRPHTNQFSMALAQGAVTVGRVSFVSVMVLSAAAFFLWLLMARRTLAGIRSSEERYRLLFDSAADAIV